VFLESLPTKNLALEHISEYLPMLNICTRSLNQACRRRRWWISRRKKTRHQHQQHQQQKMHRRKNASTAVRKRPPNGVMAQGGPRRVTIEAWDTTCSPQSRNNMSYFCFNSSRNITNVLMNDSPLSNTCGTELSMLWIVIPIFVLFFVLGSFFTCSFLKSTKVL
jgi:hypothetical protein